MYNSKDSVYLTHMLIDEVEEAIERAQDCKLKLLSMIETDSVTYSKIKDCLFDFKSTTGIKALTQLLELTLVRDSFNDAENDL